LRGGVVIRVELSGVAAKEYAEACATGEWSGCRAEPIEIRQWLEKWQPGMSRDGLSVAVFPTPAGKGAVVDPVTFNELNREVLAKVVDCTSGSTPNRPRQHSR
jgi:hypothetical protein